MSKAKKGQRSAPVLVAQGRDPPAVQEPQEPQVRSLGWEDSLEEGMATHSSTLAWRVPSTEELAGYSPWGHTESDMAEAI